MSTAPNAAPEPTPGGDQPAERRHTAGAYDVRVVIAGLIGLYGVVLTIMGIVANDEAARAKTGDWNANLWSGLVMVVVALAFAAWTRWRPVVVDPAALAQQEGEGTSDGSHR